MVKIVYMFVTIGKNTYRIGEYAHTFLIFFCIHVKKMILEEKEYVSNCHL